MKVITQIRDYKEKATMGELYINNSIYCYTLEDIGRPPGVKHPGTTCIPEGAYIAEVSFSPKYRRDMIYLHSIGQSDIIRHGVCFSGVRVHKGNTIEDTDGCIIVGEHSNHINKVWKCSYVEGALTNLVKINGECIWVISSK